MALLEVVSLTVRRRGVLALADVSLSVGRGEIVGLIGPNGAGKTTLFDAVGGFLPVTSGTVRLAGRDLAAASPDRRARLGLGRTFQQPRLARSQTVGECLLTGCQSRMRTGLVGDTLRLWWSRREELLARREAERVAVLLGIDGLLDAPAGDLPLGQVRLVEVGRALCAAPSVLLLDEAVSGVGRGDAEQLRAMVRRVRDDSGVGILAVEHDVDFVLGLCDFVYVLDAGRLIARGRPDVIREHPAVVAAYLGDELHAAAGA